MIKTTVNYVVDTATPVTYGASAFAVVTGLGFNEWVALGGLTLGVLTFVTNFYFKHKTYKLEERRTKGVK